MNKDATCNVICLKWGTRYPAAYTNTLFRSVKKHLHRPFRFVCVTDDPTGLDEGIDAVPFPANPGYKDEKEWPGIFSKLAITQDGFANLEGPTLFLDVDVVIMDDDIAKIPAVMKTARKTLSISRQNIVFALSVKFACLLLGALGIANMWVAVFADVGVAVICILNSMRMLEKQE